MDRSDRTHLALYLAAGYALLIVYASLHPLTGWRDSGVELLAFLGAPWPRYYTAFDIVTNAVAYLPFGFFAAAALRHHLPPLAALTAAFAVGTLLSVGLECVQNFLPSRVPSNLDLACNAAGALVGGLIGARWGRRLDGGRLARWRRATVVRGYGVDVGMVLAGAWLLTQLSPETLLFGTGDLRRMLDLPPAQPFAARAFVNVESAIAALGLLAGGLTVTLLLRPHARWLAAAAIAAAMLLRMLAHALMMGPQAAVAWITPGNLHGIGAGLALWATMTIAPRPLQRAAAALALLLATVMVNLAPENPYLANTLQIWNPGQFLNFNGLTRLVCTLWPFVALPWLMLYRPEREDHA